MENILNSIKKVLGIIPSDTAFDDEILIHINSAFSTLNQFGLDFLLIDKNDEWFSVLDGRIDLEFIKTYIFLRVRLLFDPPQNAFLVDSIKEQIKELEWRINALVDPSYT